MRAFLIVIALVVLAGIGWFLMGANDTPTVSNDQPVPAAEAVEDTADGPQAETEEAPTDAVEATVADSETPADQAETTAEQAGDGAPPADGTLADALTVEGFDADRIRQAIAESDMNAAQKQAAETLLASAEQNPELVQTVIDQLRERLGL